MAEGDKRPRGVRGPPPPDEIWCILRYNFEKCYSVCTNLVWRLDDFFRYSYLYTVMITIFLGGGGWGSWAFWAGSFYPSNTLDRTLTIVNPNHFRPRSGS